MIKYAVILGLIATMTSASTISLIRKDAVGTSGASPLGVVTAYRCGGVGTPVQLRISECEGRCMLTPGRVYNCEEDFIPSSATASLTLKIETCFNSGFCMQILESVLPNSSIQPGFVYTAKYSIVPNDILSGQTVEFRGYLLHTDIARLEICVSAVMDIAELTD